MDQFVNRDWVQREEDPDDRRMKRVRRGGGGAIAGGHPSAKVVGVMQDAFVSALSTSLRIGASVAFAGAVGAWLLIERNPQARPQTPAEHVAESAPLVGAQAEAELIEA